MQVSKFENFDYSFIPVEVKKYVTKFGSCADYIYTNSTKRFNVILTIPANAEFENIPFLLDSIKKNRIDLIQKTLVLLNLNCSEQSSDLEVENNRKSLELVKQIANEGILNIAAIDSFSEGRRMPNKFAGVGLARKTVMDTALLLFDYSIGINNIMVCTDCDCTVSENYLEEIFSECINNKKTPAVVDYAHPTNINDPHYEAIICYEIFLRYYTQMMRFANSPYTYHTIGSTMISDVANYVKAGGMNKKKAGEDFYFLEHLSKISKIYTLNNATVYPSSRISLRVPFGTGQRIDRFLSNTRNEYLLHQPKVFDILKKWHDIFFADSIETAETYLLRAKDVDLHLYNFLLDNNFDSEWSSVLLNSKTEQQKIKQKRFWFDTFRTLKLVHYLRDVAYNDIDMFEAVDFILAHYNIKTEGKNSSRVDMGLSYLIELRKLAKSTTVL